MHAGLCSRSTQCGTVWPGLVHGRGEPIARAREKGGATTPHCDGACGFLKFWSLNLTGNCSGGACSSPGQSRLLSVGSLSGYLYMTGHEEPPAQLSPGVMPLLPVEEELAGSWPDLSWPDSPAVVTRASSQLQLRLQKILAWITTASRAPAGTHHPWREGGLPVRQDSQPSCWVAPRKPQPILRSSRWI